jgi:hypothetical protein
MKGIAVSAFILGAVLSALTGCGGGGGGNVGPPPPQLTQPQAQLVYRPGNTFT